MNKGFTLIETLVSLTLLLLAVLFSARITVFALEQARQAARAFPPDRNGRLLQELPVFPAFCRARNSPTAQHRQASREFKVSWRVKLDAPGLKRVRLRVAGAAAFAAAGFFTIEIHPGGNKMIKGFGILEMLVALSLGLGILTVIIAHSAESARVAKKITGNQERLEAIFHTVDTIKSDLNKCGMRLQEARQFFDIPPFASAAGGFTLQLRPGRRSAAGKRAAGAADPEDRRERFFQKGQGGADLQPAPGRPGN